METIIVEFLLGMIVAAVPTFLIITRAALKPATLGDSHQAKEVVESRLRRPSRASSARSKPVRRQRANHRNMKREGGEPARARSRGNDGSADPSEVASTAIGVLDTCPSCGLEAPHDLLNEHFLGSPAHQYGAAKDDPKQNAITTALPSVEEDSTKSVRNLLQMLVPPRAFGRRHLQRQHDPLAEIVSR